jgi:hypothetical protein
VLSYFLLSTSCLKLAPLPVRSLLPSSFYLDHSRGPVLAPATLAALPSTRAIETRSLPSSLAATHRGFAFYVAFPKSSIPSIATCSISLVPFARFLLLTFLLLVPAITNYVPRAAVRETVNISFIAAESGGAAEWDAAVVLVLLLDGSP